MFKVILLVGLLLLAGCAGPQLPTTTEAPYEITWSGPTGTSHRIYSDNYELGSSVIIRGYWEFHRKLPYEFRYSDGILVLDASRVEIEVRGK